MQTIKIASVFADTPGARHKTDGPFSGQDFRERILRPRFDALKPGEKLLIDFDGAFGYPTSFLEEAFGGLARELGNVQDVLTKLEFKSDDEPHLIKEVKGLIENAIQGI